MISVVICSINPVKFQAIVANYKALMGDEIYEVVGIHDASSLCEGYNRGAAKAKGDLIIFCHDDIEILNPEFTLRLKRHLEEVDIVGVAGTQKLIHGSWYIAGPPYIAGQVAHLNQDGSYRVEIFGSHPAGYIDGIQALDGLFFAVRREVLEKIRFDEETFDGFHFYDLDFTFCAYLQGFRLRVANDIHLIHASVGNTDAAWQEYMQRFVVKYAEHLYPAYPAEAQCSFVRTTSKAQILRILDKAVPCNDISVSPQAINLLVCIDWQQPMAEICEIISGVARALAERDIPQDLCLYVEVPDAKEAINDAFQYVFFQLLVEGIDLSVKPCLCLFDGQAPDQWQALLPYLAGRITTPCDSQRLLPAVSKLLTFNMAATASVSQ
jgi:Glycosyltransferase like family